MCPRSQQHVQAHLSDAVDTDIKANRRLSLQRCCQLGQHGCLLGGNGKDAPALHSEILTASDPQSLQIASPTIQVAYCLRLCSIRCSRSSALRGGRKASQQLYSFQDAFAMGHDEDVDGQAAVRSVHAMYKPSSLITCQSLYNNARQICLTVDSAVACIVICWLYLEVW